jgi:hypothetical protein
MHFIFANAEDNNLFYSIVIELKIFTGKGLLSNEKYDDNTKT